MATHERFVQHDGPCICREGRIEVVFWSPNHSFGRGSWETNLRCPTCRKDYALRQRQEDVWLELRSEVNEHEAQSQRQNQALTELRNRAFVPIARAIVEKARSAGRTLRDWHGVVSPAFGNDDFNCFSREVRSVGHFGEWVAQQMTPTNAEPLAKAFGILAPNLKDLLTAYRAAKENVRDATVQRIELPT